MKEKVTYAFLLLLVAVLILGAASGAAAGDARMAEEASGTADVPNEVDLYFRSNPTTGYSWIAEVENEGIISLQDQYMEDLHPEGMTGVGGVHWFHISGTAPGVTSVRFRYLRPWDPYEDAGSSLYRLTVDENLNVLIWGVEVGE